MNGRNKIERAKSKNKVSKVSKIQKNGKNEKQEIILKPMKYIKITTYEDCFQIMNPIQKTVQSRVRNSAKNPIVFSALFFVHLDFSIVHYSALFVQALFLC